MAKNTLIDSCTGFPHCIVVMDKLEEHLTNFQSLGLVVISISGLDGIEESEGPLAYDDALKRIAKEIANLRGTKFNSKDIIAMTELGIPTFMVFSMNQKNKKALPESLMSNFQDLSLQIEEQLNPVVLRIVSKYTKSHPKLALGYSSVVYNPLVRPRRLIYRLIEDAKQIARIQLPLTRMKNKETLQKIILEENITTVYQPILNLHNQKFMGFEALTRGPRGTAFEHPITLFSVAKDVGLFFELDRLCRKKALYFAKDLPSNCKIFVNSLPTTINDPQFRGSYLKNFLKEVNRKSDNIVFEINERFAIDNYSSFKDAINYYRELGMLIAIDDTGTGYSTLEAIVELHPRYLKFDLSMVSGIHESTIKQEMLKLLNSLASKVNSEIIAEGIEDKRDLDTLVSMGVELGQGFYFARPMPVQDILKNFKSNLK